MTDLITSWNPAKWSGWPHSLRRGFVELLFPATCQSCSAEMEMEGSVGCSRDFCPECLDSLELFDGTMCAQCGAPLADAATAVHVRPDGCVHCSGRKLWFDATIAAGRYAGQLRQLLLRSKHREGQSLALAIGRLIAQRCGERLTEVRPDVVVPIPLHWRRRLLRGTNSAGLLAEIVAANLRVPFADGLMRRHRNTRPQFECTPPQRWENVKRAFSIASGYRLNNAHVLLVDDILTTGATCSEAARELRRGGAARVTVVVAARSITQ